MLVTVMKTSSPPTLLCKALSGWTLSRLLSPISCNLQVLHALSKRNIIMRKLSVATEKASICVNNLIRDISSIFGCINNPPFCSMSRFKALKISSLLTHNRFFPVGFVRSKRPLRRRCWGEDFLPPKEFLMLRSELSGFRKDNESTVSICNLRNVSNYLI